MSPPRRVEVNRLPSTVFEFFTHRRYYQHVDFESHRVEQSLIGSMPFAGAILVVSATDSVMPQTRDSVRHARESGIPRIIPVLSRCDEVPDVEMLDLIALEIDDLLTSYEFRCEIQAVRTAALPALSGDEHWLSRLGALVDALDATIAA